MCFKVVTTMGLEPQRAGFDFRLCCLLCEIGLLALSKAHSPSLEVDDNNAHLMCAVKPLAQCLAPLTVNK